MAKDTQLSKGRARSDPLLTFKWVANTVPFGSEFKIGPEYIETFELPFNNVKSEGVFQGGGYNYFPGFHDVSAFNVTFYGDSEGRVLRYLMYWKSRVKNFNTGIYNLPPEYKRTWSVSLLDTRGSVVLTAELLGCWPADTGQLNLDYNDGSGRITFNQNFSVDDVKIVGT